MQQGGGSQYGVPPPPGMPSFGATAEAASPISSRPPPTRSINFEELGPAVPGNFPDDEALAAAGEEADRGGVPGNRWPRQETLALLKIRSEMDAAFRDATLKGPLWEEVSRFVLCLSVFVNPIACKCGEVLNGITDLGVL